MSFQSKKKSTKVFIYGLIITISISCTLESEVDFTKDRDHIEVSSAISILKDSVKPIIIDVSKSKREELLTSNLVDKDYQLIKLETIDESLIGKIQKVLISKEKIYVLDSKISKKLFCFDIKGKFLRVIGVKGDGPGEIDTPLDFDITDNYIYLIDRRCKVNKFDLEGNFKSEIKLPFHSTIINVFDDENMFFYSHDNQWSPYYLSQINQSKKLVSLDFKHQSEFVDGYGVPKAFSRNGLNSLFLKFLDDTVYNLSPNGIFPKYIINYPKREKDNSLAAFKSNESIDKLSNARRASDAKIANDNFAENNTDFTFTTEIDLGVLGINFYNKKLKKSSPMFTSFIDDMFFLGANVTPVGLYESNFIYTIDLGVSVSSYSKVLEKAKSDKSLLVELEKEQYAKIIKLIKQSEEDDNPILLLTKVNPKIYEN